MALLDTLQKENPVEAETEGFDEDKIPGLVDEILVEIFPSIAVIVGYHCFQSFLELRWPVLSILRVSLVLQWYGIPAL